MAKSTQERSCNTTPLPEDTLNTKAVQFWVHNKLKKSRELPENFNLLQCFFGEHLLKIYPYKYVAIAESEKSAIIANMIMPELIWLAAGNL